MTPRATSNWLAMHARFHPLVEALVEFAPVDDAAQPARPARPADRRWTYAEAHERSLMWAARLSAEGVGAGDRVALLAHNTIETFALLFACAEIGATLVPLNWRLAPVELADQLERTRPAAVLGDAAFLPTLLALRGALPVTGAPAAGVPVAGAFGFPRVGAMPVPIALDSGPEAAATEGPGSALDTPWVMLFTSGSTGRPKGALLSHSQLHWNAVNTTLACDLGRSDSTLTFTPLFHTGGLNCLSTPLLHRGGRVVVSRGFDAAEALRLIEAERVSLLMGVPTIFQMMADHPRFAGADLSTVRDALCGGAPLGVPLLRRYLARGIPLRQGFGLTEVGPNCFSMPAKDAERKAGSVGLPIHHVDARLVRPDGVGTGLIDCADDEPGELILGGPAVCSGYFEDPVATAESLIDGWFHTGDVLSRDREGYFWVSGRIKELYISGGENVYPAEVEAALLRCGGVREAAVIGVADGRWGEVGAAFITVDSAVDAGRPIDSATVLDELRGHLARFKIPKTVTVCETLPRTASGKIDKPTLRGAG